MGSVRHTIKRDRFVLRQFCESDIDNVFKGLSHPDVIQYYGVNYQTLEECNNQVQFYSDLEKNGTGISWAICSPDNQLFYGAAGLNNLDRQHQKAEICFWLLPEFWGQRVLLEVIPFICHYGYNQLRLHRIEAIVESDNSNCKSLLKKFNFDHEGTMKDCEKKNDKFISLDIFASLASTSG